MAKKEDNAVIIFEGTDQLIEQTIAELKKSTVTDEALAALKEQYSGMVIAGIEDMKGYKAVSSAVSTLRKLRTSVEARRKELTEPALKFQREVKAEADRITAELKPLEDSLKQQVANIDDAREAARRAEYQRRLALLTECGYQLVNGFLACGVVSFLTDELTDLTDDQLAYYEKHGRDELARQAAEAQRKIDEEKKRQEEAESLAAERAEIARMKAELAAEKEKAAQEIAELKAQKEALEKTYETVTDGATASPSIEFDMQKSVPATATATDKDELQPIAPRGTVEGFLKDPVPPLEAAKVVPSGAANNRPVWVPQNEYERGFNAFRVQLVALVGDPNSKLTRALLTEWAWNLPPTDSKQQQ